MNPAAPTVRCLNTFNRLLAGSLAILLSSCASLKAPRTLFITYAIDEEDFRAETTQIRSLLNKYTEAFQRSNPDVNVVFINYKSKNFYDQVARDSSLNLGPDLVITNQFSAPELLARDLIMTLPSQQDFDAIYSQRIQSRARTKAGYLFAPWLINTQIACFNKTKIKDPPSTIQELEELSASGKESDWQPIFLSSDGQRARRERSQNSAHLEEDYNKSSIPRHPGMASMATTGCLYKNISFHENFRELSLKLKNNELDWITCWGGTALEDLKKTMGNKLGVAALPNGRSSKAFPPQVFYGFSLGKIPANPNGLWH